jgi:hypothetical protein
MTNKELVKNMLAFIETQNGDYFDEWYASPRDFAATILDDFAKYLGIEMIIPEMRLKRKRLRLTDRLCLTPSCRRYWACLTCHMKST